MTSTALGAQPATSAAARHSAPTQFLHWLTAILVLAAFIYGPGGSEARVYVAARDFERHLHETLGVAVLLLSVVRIAWTALDSQRPAAAPSAPWMEQSARLMKLALYALLFIVPISAIAGAWLEGHPVTLLGGLSFAPLLAESHGLGSLIAEAHGWLGDVILWLAGLHAAAAVFHHHVLKDGVLRSMLPWGRAQQR